MRRRFATSGILLFIFLAITGCKSTPATLPPNTHIDEILVIKSQHTLALMSNGIAVKTYRVALGRGSGAAKEREGDHETPEGFYTIDSRNPHSNFHLALHISYPNAADKTRARIADVRPGGDIMIHGIKNGLGWLGPLQREVDWTDGCIAVTDPEIEEIWRLVPDGTSIEIRH
ncbi:hypothetical protein GCM10011507_08030 [Edaphobacter acidisoli]|uniref:L,D-TPase catalytic domain-containing protein n=1 Tax=Edaphobacter acidisoli TaxID=2040573 RepID=A0A916RKR5_9BACT|nr:L,D-transpeptidase family protein [Edaphobacter acidisoli]GGA59050.1 hypothetical protein GCM10011507_08030 [Edaphobacter acidisoli]